MSIKITHNPDGSIDVECGDQRVTIQPGTTSPSPAAGPPIDPFGGGSPGAMLMMPIDVGRLLARGSRLSRTTAFAQPGGTVRIMMTELAPQPAPQVQLLLRLPRGRHIDLAEYATLVEALSDEGITLRIVTGS